MLKYYDRNYYDGFVLGSKLKKFWNSLGIESKANIISILAMAAIGAAGFVAIKLKDRKTIKQIQSGEITEEDLVKEIARKFLRDLNNYYFDYETAQLLRPQIEGIKNAKTFEEIKKYYSSDELDKIERLYRKAKASSNNKELISRHDSMPWVKKRLFNA